MYDADIQEKKFVSMYLPKELAEQIEAVKDHSALEKELLAYVEKTRSEFHQSIESLDEDVLIYRARVQRAREALTEAYGDYTQANYELWENSQADIKKVGDLAKAAVAELAPIKNELEQVNELLKGIHKWGIEDLLKLLNQLGSADRKSQRMLKFLFANYRETRDA